MSTKWLGVAALAAGFVVVPAVSAVVSGSGVNHRDRSADVKGGAGPDIRTVAAFERAGVINFRIGFAKAPPLAFSTKQGFTDMLIVTISTKGKVNPKQANYALGVHGADLKHVGLVNHSRNAVVWLGPAVVSGKSVTVSLDAHRIGNPKVIRFSVAAGREMNEGSGGGEDYAPNSGTWLWVR